MEVDAEFRRQIVTVMAAAIGFVAAIVVVGLSFDSGVAGSGLPPAGGLAVVGLIVAFILTMAGIGFYLDQTDTE
ncbi:MAG: hypothetical protein A07HR60_00970 [uncultured archaeon A07HR60]|jgi:hypothetical protein|nr:MAG: hypothetical protein A07HR60_00970 [uncultured archaeon A07HR60]